MLKDLLDGLDLRVAAHIHVILAMKRLVNVEINMRKHKYVVFVENHQLFKIYAHIANFQLLIKEQHIGKMEKEIEML